MISIRFLCRLPVISSQYRLVPKQTEWLCSAGPLDLVQHPVRSEVLLCTFFHSHHLICVPSKQICPRHSLPSSNRPRVGLPSPTSSRTQVDPCLSNTIIISTSRVVLSVELHYPVSLCTLHLQLVVASCLSLSHSKTPLTHARSRDFRRLHFLHSSLHQVSCTYSAASRCLESYFCQGSISVSSPGCFTAKSCSS
jgi:hypothetical protein